MILTSNQTPGEGLAAFANLVRAPSTIDPSVNNA